MICEVKYRKGGLGGYFVSHKGYNQRSWKKGPSAYTRRVSFIRGGDDVKLKSSKLVAAVYLN